MNSLRTMRSTKAKGTGPEIRLRVALYSAGLRGYRLNLRGLPGRPDIAFPRHKLAVFVHGCFWHRCPTCNPRPPKSNARFWRKKFAENVMRDTLARRLLDNLGWSVIELWECEIEESAAGCAERVVRWLAAAKDQ